MLNKVQERHPAVDNSVHLIREQLRTRFGQPLERGASTLTAWVMLLYYYYYYLACLAIKMSAAPDTLWLVSLKHSPRQSKKHIKVVWSRSVLCGVIKGE
jgi:hypothetical protein